MALSPEAQKDLVTLIVNTIAYDAGRGGHTAETLVAALRDMRVIKDNPETTVRICIASLLQTGKLDMRTDGTLLLPEELPEQDVELFHGFWWSVVTGRRIGGPFCSKGEALVDLLSLQTKSLSA